MPEVDYYLSNLNIPVEYHLAVPNKRIGTFENSDYSVLTSDRSRLMALEFFYKKYVDPSETREKKMRYFMQMEYLKTKGNIRLASCSFKYKDITIDENLNVYLCATASDTFGSLVENDPNSLFKTEEYKTVVNMVRSQCKSCVHYIWYPSLYGIVYFFRDRLFKRICYYIFKIKLWSISLL